MFGELEQLIYMILYTRTYFRLESNIEYVGQEYKIGLDCHI